MLLAQTYVTNGTSSRTLQDLGNGAVVPVNFDRARGNGITTRPRSPFELTTGISASLQHTLEL